MYKNFGSLVLACFCFMLLSCGKEKPTAPVVVEPPGNEPPTGAISLYQDSVFYISENGKTVSPLTTATGVYSSKPDGLKMEERTGEIDINKSETGLKYLVTFTPDNGDAPKTSSIIISGINYQDKIYNLSKGDSIAVPIYNADNKLALPGNSGTFDQGGGCKKAGIDVNNGNGKINLALSVRNQGIDTGATEEVKLAYRLNDNSKQSLNGLDVKIYFYRTASEIPQYLTDLLAERKSSILQSSLSGSFSQSSLVLATLANKVKKPVRARPPCIIVVSR